MPLLRQAQAHRLRRLAAVLLVLAGGTAVGCSAAIDPRAIEDAQTVVRIRSALINDPTLGTRPVEVRVAAGTVHLTGQVYSKEEAERLVDLVRGVSGVVAVESDVQVVAAPPPGTPVVEAPPPEPEPEALDPAGDRRLLAIGATVTFTNPRDALLNGRWAIGPIIRLGSGGGLGPIIGFSWTTAELFVDDGPTLRSLGHVRLRPFMGGVGYTWRGTRVSATASFVAGYSFNSLQLGRVVPDRVIALDVDNSLAWRPGLSLWYDLSQRIAIAGFVGYLRTRPRAAFLEPDGVELRTLGADSSVLSVGVAYKVF